jgi:hypothetical protein
MLSEYQWLKGVEPVPMYMAITHGLPYMGADMGHGRSDHPFYPKLSWRKVKLWQTACVRRVAVSRNGDEVPGAVAHVEEMVDGEWQDEIARKNRRLLWIGNPATPEEMVRRACAELLTENNFTVSLPFTWAARASENYRQEKEHQASLMRDVFGNPWRAVALPNESLTPDVVGLAQTIYERSEWDLACILADALEDAGCRDEDVLNHLRGRERCPDTIGGVHQTAGYGMHGFRTCGLCHGSGWIDLRGPHCKGCWVVDLVLGRT